MKSIILAFIGYVLPWGQMSFWMLLFYYYLSIICIRSKEMSLGSPFDPWIVEIFLEDLLLVVKG